MHENTQTDKFTKFIHKNKCSFLSQLVYPHRIPLLLHQSHFLICNSRKNKTRHQQTKKQTFNKKHFEQYHKTVTTIIRLLKKTGCCFIKATVTTSTLQFHQFKVSHKLSIHLFSLLLPLYSKGFFYNLKISTPHKNNKKKRQVIQ